MALAPFSPLPLPDSVTSACTAGDPISVADASFSDAASFAALTASLFSLASLTASLASLASATAPTFSFASVTASFFSFAAETASEASFASLTALAASFASLTASFLSFAAVTASAPSWRFGDGFGAELGARHSTGRELRRGDCFFGDLCA